MAKLRTFVAVGWPLPNGREAVATCGEAVAVLVAPWGGGFGPEGIAQRPIPPVSATTKPKKPQMRIARIRRILPVMTDLPKIPVVERRPLYSDRPFATHRRTPAPAVWSRGGPAVGRAKRRSDIGRSDIVRWSVAVVHGNLLRSSGSTVGSTGQGPCRRKPLRVNRSRFAATTCKWRDHAGLLNQIALCPRERPEGRSGAFGGRIKGGTS